MPRTQALRLSLNNTAEGFRKLYRKVHFDIRINLTEADDYFEWSSPDCPCCVSKQATAPICWIWEAGFIEGGSFVTGGHLLDVRQTQCRWRPPLSPLLCYPIASEPPLKRNLMPQLV
jgi:hypothetical protein